jgi:thiamine-phosphate pyrophosphorylase
MKAIVLSAQKHVEDEIEKVITLFENGLKRFHLRKPHYTKKRMKAYLDKIPRKYHPLIVIHSHHKLALKYNLKGVHLTSKDRKSGFFKRFNLKIIKYRKPMLTVSTSFNSISDLEKFDDLYDYVFLSPIFDSISKKDYQSGFKEFRLTSAVQSSNYKIVALGGLNNENVHKVFKMGFWGSAFLGIIWSNESPLDTFIEIKKTCDLIKRKPI